MCAQAPEDCLANNLNFQPLQNSVLILQHEDVEYGAEIGTDGQHSGGPFFIDVSPTMRIEDVRLIIQVSLNA